MFNTGSLRWILLLYFPNEFQTQGQIKLVNSAPFIAFNMYSFFNDNPERGKDYIVTYKKI